MIKRYMLCCCYRICLVLIVLSIGLTLPLRWFNPLTTAFIVADQQANVLTLRNHWVTYDQLSPYLPLAVMAAEDQKFPTHHGFDFTSLKKALMEKREKRRGASTISQQLTKNLYLWSGRSLIRKGIEAWLTLWLELWLSKQRILELYVNVVEYGPGIYGVAHASEHFFKRSPKLLNPQQSALLASVLPNPKQFSATKPSSYLYKRARRIRLSMNNLGGVDFLQQLGP